MGITTQPQGSIADAIANFNSDLGLLDVLASQTGLKRQCSTNGGEYHGPCPACGGEDRFIAWPTPRNEYPSAWCRQCGIRGDTLSWAMRHFEIDPKELGATARFLKLNNYL